MRTPPPTPPLVRQVNSPWNDHRIQAGVSLRELERRTGISRARLSIIERGVTPTPDEAARILAALRPQEGTAA